MENKDFDLAVIGAGSAGFSAAITGAEAGGSVALIGHGTIGGTCVNVGCVPSKNLIRAAETIHQARSAGRFQGIKATAEVADWSAVMAQKTDLVSQLRKEKYADLLTVYPSITYIEGRARLKNGGVEVNGRFIRSKKTVIATGASSAAPSIEGIEAVSYLTSTTALELEKLPESLLVIGGGYIGCELAQMFARMGVKVTIACRSRLLPHMEPEISDALTGYFEQEGIIVRGALSYRKIRETAIGVALDIVSDGAEETVEAEKVLVTSGRRPNTDGLGLEEAGIETGPNGGISVNDHMRTSKESVYAAGDVTGRDMFVYMAAYGAKIAVKNAVNGDDLRYDASVIPAVVFTDPQVASSGLTEKEAQTQGFDVKVSVLPLSHVPRALAARDTRGLIKLVADGATDRLLGAHILAPEGADGIQTAVIAIQKGMTVKELADTIFPYLTTVEGLKLAAQTFRKNVAKLSCCAG